MTLETILSVERSAAINGGGVLLYSRHGLTVGFQYPEYRDHQRDDRQHHERAIPCFLDGVGTRIKGIEQRTNRKKRYDNTYGGLYRTDHNYTSLHRTLLAWHGNYTRR